MSLHRSRIYSFSMRAAIYTRISDDRTGNRAGVERQEMECRALADAMGWEIVKVCSDNSISAYNGLNRPGFDDLGELIRGERIDAVVTWAADRLTRHPRELENLVDLFNETGTKVKTVTSGEYDLTSADGRAHARIIGAIARQESEKKSERIKSQKAQAASQGKRPGGPRAFGWTTGRANTIPAELEVVGEVADRVLAGESISTVTRDLNGRKIRTPRGNEWSRNTVRQMLTNPATAGLRKQPDGGVISGEWDGAFSRKTWNQLCAILNDPARTTTHRLRSYVLTGLAYDTEGRKLVSYFRRNRRSYRTPAGSGGGGVVIAADLVEGIVIEAVLRLTDDLKIAAVVTDDAAELESIEADLENLAEMFGKGELTAGEWNAARGPLQARLAEARRAERQAPRMTDMDWAKPGLLRASWDGLTIQQQRQAVELFVERVLIGPAKTGQNAPNTDRVSVVWKA